MANITAHDAVTKLRAYIHKPRTQLPWLGKTRVKGFLDCAAAISWVLGLAGNREIVSCGVWIDHFKQQGTWFTAGIPQEGDIVIFDWASGQGMGKNQGHDHVGIVEKADKKLVTYVSADSTKPTPGLVTDNAVSYKYITGYGRPKYTK